MDNRRECMPVTPAMQLSGAKPGAISSHTMVSELDRRSYGQKTFGCGCAICIACMQINGMPSYLIGDDCSTSTPVVPSV